MTEVDHYSAFLPWIPVIVTAIGGLIVGAFGVHNRRRGNEESRMPTVAQIWERQDKQAAELRETHVAHDLLKAAYARLRDAFLKFVLRAQTGGSTILTDSERDLLELDDTTPKETP